MLAGAAFTAILHVQTATAADAFFPRATVAVTGTPAAELPGLNYGTLGSAYMNAGGAVVFTGSLTGNGTTTLNNSAIWSGVPGDLHLVAHSGDPAAGTSDRSYLINAAAG